MAWRIGAQNIVPNSSFESFTENPCGPTFDNTYYNFPKYAVDWFLANHGTSDIFGTNIPEGCWASMPLSATINDGKVPPMGFQLARDGERFAGIFTYSDIISPEPSYREYLEVKLITPLEVGEHYCAEMFVSLAEGPKFASNNLGMYFHQERIDSDTWGGYPHFHAGVSLQDYFVWGGPQILNTDVILDTLGWVRVGGIFQADVAAEYLTIGNYFRDQYTTAIDKKGRFPNGASYLLAYYFIDDIWVEKLGPKSFSFEGPTTICEGDTTTIQAIGDLRDITWTSVSDTVSILGRGEFFKAFPKATTKYRVKGRNCMNVVTDTLTVNVLPKPFVSLGDDITICKGDVFILDSGSDHVNQVWQDNSMNRYFNVTEGGKYSVSVQSSNQCTAVDTVEVFVNDVPKISLGRDTVLCGSNFYEIKAGGTEYTYLWSTGASDSILLPSASGVYWVNAYNDCGVTSDTLRIFSFNDIFVPNVLTLNGDPLNSNLEIRGIGNLAKPPSLIIFDRWGEMIFDESTYQGNWPVNPDLVSSGVYFYLLDYPPCGTYKGWIQIMKE